ncbi:hypothetical protein [Burkholderia arboris]|uniref:hypothetical protein n=1 Tax=Burkholderia arboris TaxID=488730 RepID=UPI0030EFE9B0
MEYTKERVRELVQAVPWISNTRIRLFWLRHANGSRDELAAQLSAEIGTEAIVPLVLRAIGFKDANAVLADVQALFEINRPLLESLSQNFYERLTVLVISKEDFRLVNASSPITLPDWFPICPALDTYFSVADLGQAAEVKPLNCPEARLDHVAQLLFELEEALVQKLLTVYEAEPARVGRFVDALQPSGEKGKDAQTSLAVFKEHISAVADARAYRPNAAEKSKFLAARMLKLVLSNSPKQISTAAEELSKSLTGSDSTELKPTFFAVMWRPANKTPVGTTNWHAILIAFFQAYQLMNANAHAGEFPSFAVALQYSTSINLRQFLGSAKDFIESLS